MHNSSNPKCICNLCTCGKHTCFDQTADFKGRQLEKQYLTESNHNLPYPLLSNIYHYNNINTTYQDHYQPNRRNKTEHHLQFKDVGKHTLANDVPFNGTSNYHDSYNRHYDQKVVSMINPELQTPTTPQYIRPNIKFQGESRYKSDFHDSPYMEKIRFINSQKINRKSLPQQQYPFHGQSTYKHAFKPYVVQQISQLSQKPQTPYIKFDGMSNYKDNYRSFRVKKDVDRGCPVQQMAVPSKNSINNKNHIYYDSIQRRFI